METDSPFEPTVLGAMWRYRWLVAAVAVFVAALAVLYGLSRPVQHEAFATIVVQDPSAQSLFDVGQAQRPERYVANQATILESTLVADRAAEIMAGQGFDSAGVDQGSVSLNVFWDTSSDDIDVVVGADDPTLAVAWANAVVDAYTEIRQETADARFASALQQLDKSTAAMELRLDAVQREISAVAAQNPATKQLAGQYDSALARLAELQAQLPAATGAALEGLREELDDVLQQLQTLQVVASLESQRPELAALFDEQGQLLTRRDDVLRRADELAVEARMEGTGIVISSPAADAVEVGFDLRRAGAVGLIVGLLIAAAVAYVLALRRRTFTDAGQPESILGTRLVAAVPDLRHEEMFGDLPVLTNPASAGAEAFRFVAGALRTDSTAAGGGAVYAIVSGQRGDGRTIVAANSALAAARTGSRVLAVDADFASQRLTSLLSAGDAEISLSYQTAVGLTDLAAPGSIQLSDVVKRVAVGDSEFDLLSRGSGQVSPSDFVASSQMQHLFEAIRAEYDLVVIDTPPLSKVAYAGELVRHADGALVVVLHSGNVGPVEEVAERLAVLNVDAIGYVFNRVPFTDEKAR